MWTTNTLKAVSEYEDLYVFWNPGPQVINRDRLDKEEWREWGSRGVWYIKSVRTNNEHEAQFPVLLAERVVKLYTDPGEVVLDPFMGGGTTAIAAAKWNRKYIGIEKENKSMQLALSRLRQFNQQIKLL
jgi:DNA modification methylase